MERLRVKECLSWVVGYLLAVKEYIVVVVEYLSLVTVYFSGAMVCLLEVMEYILVEVYLSLVKE